MRFRPRTPRPSPLETELRTAWGELSSAYQRLDEAADPALVEACVYRISAEKALCDYLFRTVKGTV